MIFVVSCVISKHIIYFNENDCKAVSRATGVIIIWLHSHNIKQFSTTKKGTNKHRNSSRFCNVKEYLNKNDLFTFDSLNRESVLLIELLKPLWLFYVCNWALHQTLVQSFSDCLSRVLDVLKRRWFFFQPYYRQFLTTLCYLSR